MCECQGNPLARVTLPPCKQGLSFPVTFILSISLLIHLPGKNPIKRVQSSQGLTTLLYSVYCTVERDWSDGLWDDRVSNHGFFLFSSQFDRCTLSEVLSVAGGLSSQFT